MSRLIDPTLGDILDRLSILTLKVLFGTERGTDTAHFAREQTALLAKIRSRDHSGPWFALTLELAAVNAVLWHAEDELRALRGLAEGARAQWAGNGKTWHQQLAEVGMRIQALNDRRAALIAAINKEAGEPGGLEKL